MKKYLLVGIGNLEDDAMVTYITDAMAEITSTKKLKWKQSENSIVIHFGSNRNFKEIEKYCNIVSSKCFDYHFLIQYNDLSVNLPFGQNDIFLSLDGNKKNIKEDNTRKKSTEENNNDELGQVGKNILNFLNFGFFKPNDEDCLDGEENDEDILIKKSFKKEYNLDDILDKINKTGVSSLTNEENEYLKNLSK